MKSTALEIGAIYALKGEETKSQREMMFVTYTCFGSPMGLPCEGGRLIQNAELEAIPFTDKTTVELVKKNSEVQGLVALANLKVNETYLIVSSNGVNPVGRGAFKAHTGDGYVFEENFEGLPMSTTYSPLEIVSVFKG